MIVAALLATLATVIVGRRQRKVMVPAVMALASLPGTQAIFWLPTYPVNQATSNCRPTGWGLRLQWEFSDAAGGIHLPDPGQPSHAGS